MYSGYPMSYSYMQPRTDIGQVNSEQEAVNAYVPAGSSKILFTSDDRTIYVKSVSMNGQTTMDIFDRRLPEGQKPAPEYVTKDELAKALEALKTAKKPVKTEVTE